MTKIQNIKALFCILLALSLLGCSRDCDPYKAWINDYKIFSISVEDDGRVINEQVEVSFENLLNPEDLPEDDRILKGVTIILAHWRIQFQPDGDWTSTLFISGTKSIPFLGDRTFDIIEFNVMFEGTYRVSGNTYELFVLNVDHDAPIDINPILDFMETQSFGTWVADSSICSIGPRLARFGVFTVTY